MLGCAVIADHVLSVHGDDTNRDDRAEEQEQGPLFEDLLSDYKAEEALNKAEEALSASTKRSRRKKRRQRRCGKGGEGANTP